MAYQMVATVVTLNDLEGHSPVADVFTCNPSNIFVQHFTRFQMTVCSHGSSALAELFVASIDRTKTAEEAQTILMSF